LSSIPGSAPQRFSELLCGRSKIPPCEIPLVHPEVFHQGQLHLFQYDLTEHLAGNCEENDAILVPRAAIRGAGQKDRSSGDENGMMPNKS